jgi:hypothetical protein
VVFRTDGELAFGLAITADPHGDFLAQFAEFTPDSNIIVENSPDLRVANFFTTEHFRKLPGTSLVFGGEGEDFGSAQRDDLSIGALGPLAVGSQNVAFVTCGNIHVSSTFTTRGFVGVLRLVGGVPVLIDSSAVAIQEELSEVFELPIVNEFELEDEEKQDNDQKLGDVADEGGGEGEQLVTAESNIGQMCECGNRVGNFRLNRLTVIVLLLPALGASVAARAAPSAGEVTKMTGRASAATADGDIRALAHKSPVNSGDTIATSANSFVRMRLSDGAFVVLRPNTRFLTEDYRHAENDNESRSFSSVLKGGFRAVTGAIGERHRANVSYRTALVPLDRGAHRGLGQRPHAARFACHAQCKLPDRARVRRGVPSLSHRDRAIT